ncbi:mannosyltransferase family protein [Gloeobacter morelensis]|uniref:DUF2029 domain-containing protein n=1 Tax=Gloeobacter morelensis MG652769 TaxID=2781736 RepID=A0ABY3PG31_9CYAN|nr:mannosyltransferase family protein [Gloeobacter morelensis]UFP92610.1 hypothetical protein ISF26_12215 [Gloeobacter morelensis MG652769]
MAFLLTVALRIFYCGFACVYLPFLKYVPAAVRSNDLTENLPPPAASLEYLLVGMWSRFDTLWYQRIAEHGYDLAKSVVFYPLYPLAIRLLNGFVPSPTAAALLVASVAIFLALWGLHRLLLLDYEPTVARRAVVLAALCPFGCVFWAGYADGLLLGLIVWSFYWMRRGKWPTAGILAMFAALTKAAGLLAVPVLLMLAWRSGKRTALVAPVLGVAGFALFTGWLRFQGLPTSSEVYGAHWGTATVFPLANLAAAATATIRYGDPRMFVHWVMLFSFAGALWFGRRRLPREYVVYGWVALGFFLLKQRVDAPVPLESLSRYLLVIFPAYALWAGWLSRPGLLVALVPALLLLNCLLLATFFEFELFI